jgi:hypothetical protein
VFRDGYGNVVQVDDIDTEGELGLEYATDGDRKLHLVSWNHRSRWDQGAQNVLEHRIGFFEKL